MIPWLPSIPGQQRLSARSYAAAYRLVLDLRLRLADCRGREPLLVFQMGKVGSSSVTASLRASEAKHLIFHIHFLSPRGFDFTDGYHKQAFGNWSRVPSRNKRHLLTSRFIAEQIAADRYRGRPWKIVTLVRDPVATNVSCFFQAVNLWIPELRDPSSVDVEDLIDRFFREFHHDLPLTWFDDELQGVFGVDVFANGFSRSKGYEIYQGDQAEVLLLRLEDIDRCSQEAFSTFLGFDRFTLESANVTDDKALAQLYQDFKRAIVIPDAYIEKMYSSRVARHFYSAEEIDEFRKKWSQSAN